MKIDQKIKYRLPEPGDAAAMLALVQATPDLDDNSAYCYLLMCHHFAATSAVALDEGRLAGFTTGYRVPGDTATIFVWQIAVAADAARKGIASGMLRNLLSRPALRDVRYLDATVTPSNMASDAFFRSFAARAGAACQTRELFGADLFGEHDHEPEVLYRIGPFNLNPETNSGGN